MSNYLSDQVQRTLLIVDAMAGNEIHGVKATELANNLSLSPSSVSRALANLEHAGWAEKCPHDDRLWRLGKKPVQLANTVRDGLAKAQQQIAQDTHNYSIMR